jgi:5-methylcytosine-specific restriction protein A
MSRQKRSVSESVKRQVAANWGWKCAECKEMLESTYQIDHILPLWEGGSNEMSNLQALCAGDHARKTQLEANRRKNMRDKQRCYKGRPCVECLGCGVYFSPYFTHRCSNSS